MVILESPILVALGINMYGNLGENACKHDLSVQGVESPNFKECR